MSTTTMPSQNLVGNDGYAVILTSPLLCLESTCSEDSRRPTDMQPGYPTNTPVHFEIKMWPKRLAELMSRFQRRILVGVRA